MMKKTFALAALAGAALLSTTPVLADGYRHGDSRGNGYGPKRFVVVQQHTPRYAQRGWQGYRQHDYRPAYAYQRPVVVRHAPVVAYRHRDSHDVLGGLIFGTVLGAVIASHAGY